MQKSVQIHKKLAKILIPQRPEQSNKGTFGKVLNIAGSVNYQGAAWLSSVSALKIGAGLVCLASAKQVINNLASNAPWITFIPLKDKNMNYISSEGFQDLQEHFDEYKIICAGPGLSDKAEVVSFIKKLISYITKTSHTCVLDADALNCISKLDISPLGDNTIITPHPMELSRLIKVPVDEIQNNREKYVSYAAQKFGCCVILKGNKTLVCTKELELFENTTGNSALAKAGSGDVLTGIVAGLLAQGLSLKEAGVLGVFLHGLCGDLASKELTKYSVLSTDLIDYIPNALKIILE